MLNRTIGRLKRILMSISVLAVVLIEVPVLAMEIVPDANTVILDHLNGATVGELKGTLNYDTSLPGQYQAGNFTDGTYVRYYLPVSLSSQGTIELWFKPHTYSPYNTGLVNLNWLYTDSYPWWGHVLHLYLNNAGKIQYGVWNGQGDGGILSNSVVSLDEWTHAAVSWGNAGTKMYINGMLDASTSQSIWPAAYAGNWAYLHYWGAGDLGDVDEFHISNIQRTDEEIYSHSRVMPEPTSAVPEPTRLALFSIGLSLAGFIRRSRKNVLRASIC